METAPLPLVFGVAIVTCEALTEILLSFLEGWGWKHKQLFFGVIIGVSIAWLLPDFDVFSYLKVQVDPVWAGRLLTGLLASRGANVFHDLFRLLQAGKDAIKALTESKAGES